MERQLERIYWRGILITLLMAGMAVLLAAKVKLDDTGNQLTALLHAASRWTLDSNEDLQTLADSIADVSPSLRVTFLLDSGLILADSHFQAAAAGSSDAGSAAVPAAHPVGNPGDPEIAAARKGKTGKALRISSATAALMLHMARKVSPQLILRLSYPVLPIAKTLVFYSLALLALFLILNRLQRSSIARFTDSLSRQFEDVQMLLDGQLQSVQAHFPEMQPSLDAISYRVRRLREDQQQIQETLDLRKNFVANASHELRSPLTSVQGYAEMLGEGLAATPQEQDLCIQMIRSECARMLQVISDILLLSKSEQKKERPTEYTPVLPVAEEVRQALQIQSGAAKIELLIEQETALLVQASAQDLWEILFNLTDNAIRYGREGGFVKLRLLPGQIRVEDNGIGIPSDALAHIFEPFYRVDDTRDPDHPGTGLGLSIVKAITESFGGTIGVESTPGRGTAFIITFPEALPSGSDHLPEI